MSLKGAGNGDQELQAERGMCVGEQKGKRQNLGFLVKTKKRENKDKEIKIKLLSSPNNMRRNIKYLLRQTARIL